MRGGEASPVVAGKLKGEPNIALYAFACVFVSGWGLRRIAKIPQSSAWRCHG